MGEKDRVLQFGPQARINRQPLQPGQQFQVDLKNAVPKVCECGGKYFIPVVALYSLSALLSPTGQELMAQQPVLVCMECKTPIK